ncbi:uncharacterized protein LOC62_03G003755 [Vanrija pseudolonga]|uniref:Uncharacterized protein n=1 Tax=Vanrija pseudolonga TaxID=143232 RepID=A0AAF0Y949_9TREE|nr:hypothetical protein LOC62_03G003755 [Vanrija pseudolonga]
MIQLSWTDIKDYVPQLSLSGTAKEFEAWNNAVRRYCYGKGALSHLDGTAREPFRNPKAAQGHWLGVAEPVNTEIEPSLFNKLAAANAAELGVTLDQYLASPDKHVTLPPDKLALWDRWATHERLARLAVATTVNFEPRYGDSQPSAHELYSRVSERYVTNHLQGQGTTMFW